MKKTFIFFSLFLFICNSLSFAQVDPKADKIIKSSRKKINGYNDMTSDFIWTMENKATKQAPSIKKGKILIKKDKYKIVFQDREMFCDGKNLWDYLKKEKEVNLSKNNPKEGMSFQKIFKLYDEGMKIKYDILEPIGGIKTHKMTLFPLEEKEFFKVELWIEESSENIRKIKIHNRNGTSHQFEMNNIVVNTNLADDIFTFDINKYPGVELIDLREE